MTHKKKCRASTRAHDPFFDILKIWPTFIYRGEVPGYTFAKLPVRVLINDPQKSVGHQLGLHDRFSDNLKIWPTFIYRGEEPSNTFAKLPVHVLINDLKKLDPKSSLQLKTHHLVMWPTSRSRPQCFCTFLKFSVSALINDPQKKCRASTRAHDPFFWHPQNLTHFYI